MVETRGDKLFGTLQVNETYIGEKKLGKRGRGALGKAILAIAVEDKISKSGEDEHIGRI